MYGWLADAALILHALVATIIVLGLPAIWIGLALGWGFARSRLFRFGHAGSMAFVLFEGLIGMICPLTELEDWLRRLGGDADRYGGEGFIRHWVERLLYYEAESWVFVVLYATFFALIVLTLVLWPPRKETRSGAV